MLKRFPLIFWLAAAVSAASLVLVGMPERELPIPQFQVCDETGFLYTDGLDDQQARTLIMKLGLSVNPEVLIGLAGASGTWKKSKTQPRLGNQAIATSFVEEVARELERGDELDALAQRLPCM